MLDNAKKHYMQVFNEKVNELMNACKLKQRLLEMCHMSNEETHNKIDDIFAK